MLIVFSTLVVIALLAGAATVYALVTAKNGHQDEQGFHLLEQAVVAPVRSARSNAEGIAAPSPIRSLVSASQA